MKKSIYQKEGYDNQSVYFYTLSKEFQVPISLIVVLSGYFGKLYDFTKLVYALTELSNIKKDHAFK